MKQFHSLVSIIMPCYNDSQFIEKAIDSVLEQKYSHFELIIINDGSTDDSESIILKYTDSRIRYYKQVNKGQCAASNFGLSVAKGDYIKFFDADDLLNSEHLLAQMERMNGEIDVLVSCEWARFFGDEPNEAKFIPEKVWRDMESLDWIKTSLSQRYDMMGLCIWLIPRSVINSVGGWDERLTLNNDFEFSMRLLTNIRKVLFASDAKLYYRSGNISLSSKTSEESYRKALLSTDLGCGYLLDKENTKYTKELCANRYQEWLFRIFPDYSALQIEIENKIKLLGGSNRKIEGSLLFKIVSQVLGWKKAKRIQMVLKREINLF